MLFLSFFFVPLFQICFHTINSSLHVYETHAIFWSCTSIFSEICFNANTWYCHLLPFLKPLCDSFNCSSNTSSTLFSTIPTSSLPQSTLPTAHMISPSLSLPRFFHTPSTQHSITWNTRETALYLFGTRSWRETTIATKGRSCSTSLATAINFTSR